MKKRILSGAAAVLVTLSLFLHADFSFLADCKVSAEAEYVTSEYDNDYVYYIYDDHVEIEQYFLEASYVEIPSEYKGLPVTTIIRYDNDEHIEELVIPDTVTKIEDKAFMGCGNLKKVTLSSSLETLGEKAFSGTGITEINISENVISIGEECFGECFALENINVSESNLNYRSIDGVLFSKDGTDLITYPNGKQEEVYAIPDGTEKIHDSAFAMHKYIKGIYMPETVVSIGVTAFTWCIELVAVIVSDNITDIESSAFAYCKKLEFISLPKSLKRIGIYAFSSCDSIKHLFFPDKLEKIEYGAFSGCSGLDRIVLPESVEVIEVDAFSGFNAKIMVLNPDCEIDPSRTTFGSSAIYGLPGSTAEAYAEPYYAITFKTIDEWPEITGQCGDNATFTIDYQGNMKISGTGSLYDIVFYEDEYGTITAETPFGDYFMNIKNIEIENGITYVGAYDFIDCINLEKVELPSTINKIGIGAFYGAYNLKDIVIYNPSCTIEDDEDGVTIPSQTVIYGYNNSTAHEYAKNYIRQFVALSGEPEGLVGDANSDGFVNVRDCAFIASALAKGASGTLPANADFNGDTQINVRDAAAIASYLASGK